MLNAISIAIEVQWRLFRRLEGLAGRSKNCIRFPPRTWVRV